MAGVACPVAGAHHPVAGLTHSVAGVACSVAGAHYPATVEVYPVGAHFSVIVVLRVAGVVNPVVGCMHCHVERVMHCVVCFVDGTLYPVTREMCQKK